jgi:site-specific recombinase XerD
VKAHPADDGLGRIKLLVLDAMHSPNSKAAYDAALTGFLDWYRDHARGEVFSKGLVQRWMASLQTQGLSPSTINLRLSAVKKLASEAQDNGLLDPTLATGIGRVKGIKRAGVRVGNWLTKQQAEQLLHAPDTTTLKGQRESRLACGAGRLRLASHRGLEHEVQPHPAA